MQGKITSKREMEYIKIDDATTEELEKWFSDTFKTHNIGSKITEFCIDDETINFSWQDVYGEHLFCLYLNECKYLIYDINADDGFDYESGFTQITEQKFKDNYNVVGE